MRLHDVVGLAQRHDRRAFERGAQRLERGIGDLGDGAFAGLRAHIVRHRNGDAPANHDRPRSDRHGSFALDFGRAVADQLPAEAVGSVAHACALGGALARFIKVAVHVAARGDGFTRIHWASG